MANNSKKAVDKIGIWIAIPLDSGGYGLGLVVGGRSGILLGYFFPKQFNTLPDLSDTQEICAADAILIAWFSDMGIKQDHWTILGKESAFRREDWPVPFFARVDAVDSTKGFLVKYDSENPDHTKPLQEMKCDSEQLKDLPYDGLFGSVALEVKLDSIIRSP